MKKIFIILLSFPILLGANKLPTERPVQQQKTTYLKKTAIAVTWLASVAGCSAFFSWIAYIKGTRVAKKELKVWYSTAITAYNDLQKAEKDKAEYIILLEDLQDKRKENEASLIRLINIKKQLEESYKQYIPQNNTTQSDGESEQ